MTRAAPTLLTRFPTLETRQLSVARRETERFWPRHTAAVLGPDDYSLTINRVELGHMAMTYVDCTSRIRVVSAGPAPEFSVYLPFEGDIRIVADGVEMAATSERPLLRGPTRTFVFEPSPIRCLVVDIPEVVITSLVGPEAPLPSRVSLASREAGALRRLIVRLAQAANRSRALVPLQGFRRHERIALLPERLNRLEREVLDHVLQASGQRSGAVGCDVEVLKRWLASHAHRRVRVVELAAVAGVSQRTVERAFLQTGMTPLDYLRRVRLERAQTMLSGPIEDLTVAAVAAAVGYSHLGRFADEHRGHFGELPSQALARARLAKEPMVDRTQMGEGRRRPDRGRPTAE